MKDKNIKIVCLGGGIGSVNLLKGLKRYTMNLSVVVSMADDGGSAGRLRRLYNMIPFGDLVSCMAAMSEGEAPISDLLRYRFGGDRYGKDTELGGHKLGNLIMVALKDMTGNYDEAITTFKKMFNIKGDFHPATAEPVTISALTSQGKEIHGEEAIDLGKYKGKRNLEKVFLHPKDAKADKKAVEAILRADAIILGPGDLYTNLLPVVIVPEIKEALKKTKAKKIFVINVANKPFETKGYKLSDYLEAIKRHLGGFPFDLVLTNNNFNVEIPNKYSYSYVKEGKENLDKDYKIVRHDLIREDFPLYHDPDKLAKAVWENI